MISLDQLKMAMRLHRVQRFQTHHMLEPMSVAAHSLRVGMLYAYLGGTETVAAFAHDLEEAITGDLPSPIKKDLTGLEKFESMRPQFEDAQEKRLCKLADKLDLVLHIRHQAKFSEELSDIYESELETALDIARELRKTREVKKILKEIK